MRIVNASVLPHFDVFSTTCAARVQYLRGIKSGYQIGIQVNVGIDDSSWGQDDERTLHGTVVSCSLVLWHCALLRQIGMKGWHDK